MQNIFSSLRQRIAQEKAFSHAEQELSNLSDRELNDLGLSRYDIRRVVRGI